MIHSVKILFRLINYLCFVFPLTQHITMAITTKIKIPTPIKVNLYSSTQSNLPTIPKFIQLSIKIEINFYTIPKLPHLGIQTEPKIHPIRY